MHLIINKDQGHWYEDVCVGKAVVCFSSVQFSCSVMSDSLQPHEPQHTRPPYPSPTPGVHPKPCSLSQWCHPTISSSVIPFSSCPQSFPASGLFQWVSSLHQFSSVQSLSRVRLFVTWWIEACQASLSITNSRSPPKPMCIVSVMPSNHLILCCPPLLPSIFPSIRVFFNESALSIRWEVLKLQHQSFQWIFRVDFQD